MLEMRPGSIMAVNAGTGQMKVVYTAGDRNLHGVSDGSAFGETVVPTVFTWTPDARDRRRSPFVALANSEQHRDTSKQQMGDLAIRIEWASGMDDGWHRVKVGTLVTQTFIHTSVSI